MPSSSNYLPVSKMKISLTILFFPSPSLPPKTIRNWPNCVDEWQFLVEGGAPSSPVCYYPLAAGLLAAAADYTTSPCKLTFALLPPPPAIGAVLTLIMFQPNSTISLVWLGRPSPSSPCTDGYPDMKDCIYFEVCFPCYLLCFFWIILVGKVYSNLLLNLIYLL